MSNPQSDANDAACLRCGAVAIWRFRDGQKNVVELICANCGRYEVPRAEFEVAEFDIAPDVAE